MTEKQFQKAVAKGVKFYRIWLQGTSLHKQEVPVENFMKSWTMMNWINQATPYNNDPEIRQYVRYVSSDQFNTQVMKYFDDLREEYLFDIREAEKKLNKLTTAIEKAKAKL